MRTQNRFDGVEWDLQLAEPRARAARRSRASSSRCCINLFLNAADAMSEKNPTRRAAPSA